MQTHLRATYQDGFILDEKKANDTSLFVDGKNTFYDIVNGLPESEHGSLQELTLFADNKKYTIDWNAVPDGSRPIRVRHMRLERNMGTGETLISVDKTVFGYQWTDKTVTPWENKKQVINI